MPTTEISRASIGASRNPATETAILDAAEALIAEEGYGAMTMEAVARRARAGKATVYRWWPSRGHLLLAVYSRARADMVEPDTGNLRDDLTVLVGDMLTRWQGDASHAPIAPLLRLVIAESQIDPAVRAAVEQERRSRWNNIDTIVARAATRGELHPALTVDAAVDRVISLLWYLLLTDRLPPASAVTALVDQMLPGLTR